MINMRNLKFLAALIIIILVSLGSASAASNDNSDIDKAKATLKVLKSKLKEFKKSMRDSRVRTALTDSSSSLKGLDDSDSDGLPDLYEHALDSDSCDSDSDDDGLDDHEEGSSGSKPGSPDSGEIEVKALITAISDTSVTVDGHVFTVFANTVYRDGASLASYAVGELVEVKGQLINGVLTLIKIHKDDD